MKAIFFDIDGTLFDNNIGQGIPESCVSGIRLAQENGNLCFINTGRTKRLIERDITDRICFDGYLLGCGMTIIYKGETLLKKTLDYDLTKEIIEFLRSNRIDAILEGDEDNYDEKPGEFFTKRFEKYAGKYTDRNFGRYEAAYGKFLKLFAYTEEEGAMERFFERFSDRLEIIDRENGFYEILLKGCSKATAMDFICERLNIPLKDTVAIGDSNNDLPMLKHAGCAIAMGRSSKDVLACADYVTTDIGDDGVYNALKWLGVI